jgi:uncharacterized CHY-type Zn-finger protein
MSVFDDLFKMPKGYTSLVIPGNEQKKKKPVKKPKPEIGKKPVEKKTIPALPEKKVVCPYCKTVNTFPEGKASRYCSECGKAYFRP